MGAAGGRRSLCRAGVALSAVAALVVLGACSGSGEDDAKADPGGRSTGQATQGTAARPVAPTVTVAFSKIRSRVRPDRPIRVNVASGRLFSVSVTDGDGDAVAGTLGAGGVWTATRSLHVASTYTLTAVAKGEKDQTTSSRVKFTTISPSRRLAVDSITPASGEVVGVGMPISVTFARPVTSRAAVQRRLQVTTRPAVAGVWHWFSSTRVDYRPRRYWAPGTKVTLRAAFNGVNAGSNRWGTADYTRNFTIGAKVITVVNAHTHRMTVSRNGRLLRKLPTGTGKRGFDTWGGTMVVIDKEPVVRMDSCSVHIACTPGSPGFYDMNVYQDVRLTPSGTFIHNASWDGLIGEANISHGCIHLTPSAARWFYKLSKPGDVVQVVGTPEQVAPDNGFGDWNLSWSKWVAGSALPVAA